MLNKCLSRDEARFSSLKTEVLGFRQVTPFWSHKQTNAIGVKKSSQIWNFL